MKKVIKKLFALSLIMVMAMTVFVGCGSGNDAKDLWDDYVTAVNRKDIAGVARTFYSTSSTAYPRFISENTNEDGSTNYFDGISSVRTTSFEYLVQSDVTSAQKWEKYASARISIVLTASDGIEETKDFDVYFQSGERNIWTFTNPVNITSYDYDELGNQPNDLWNTRTILVYQDFKYKVIQDSTNGNYISIVKYTGNSSHVEIPSEIDGVPVRVIKSYAFYKYTRFLTISMATSKIKTLVIPETVETIEDYAFWQCKKLTEITIPSSVSVLGGSEGLSFASCTNLRKITINVDDSEMYESMLTEVASTSTDDLQFSGARNMYVGDIINLRETSDKLVYWTVDNADVISIDRDTGVARAIKNGTATITASLASDPAQRATVRLTVSTCPTLLRAGSSSFDRCSKLETIVVNAINPNCIDTARTSFRLSEDVVIVVPKGSLAMYRNNEVWSAYSEQIVEEE